MKKFIMALCLITAMAVMTTSFAQANNQGKKEVPIYCSVQTQVPKTTFKDDRNIDAIENTGQSAYTLTLNVEEQNLAYNAQCNTANFSRISDAINNNGQSANLTQTLAQPATLTQTNSVSVYATGTEYQNAFMKNDDIAWNRQLQTMIFC